MSALSVAQSAPTFDLRLGDCLDPVTGLASLADGSVDAVLCDPPYSEHVHAKQRSGNGKGRRANGDIAADRDLGFGHITPAEMDAIADQCERVSRRWVLVFSDIESASLWRGALTSAGLEYIRTGAWVKPNSQPQFTGDRPAAGFEAITIAHRPGKKRWNGGGAHALWTAPIVQHDRQHPTEKPLQLMETLALSFTDPGDLILDPFAGSGTTGVAAIRNGRRFVGWEKDPKHHATAMRRLSAAREQLSLFGRTA